MTATPADLAAIERPAPASWGTAWARRPRLSLWQEFRRLIRQTRRWWRTRTR